MTLKMTPYDFLLVCHCNYIAISRTIFIFKLFDIQYIVTLKYELGVTQGHKKWHHSIDRVRVPIRLSL